MQWSARRWACKQLSLCRPLNATALNCENLVWLSRACRLHCGEVRGQLLPLPARQAPVCAGPLTPDLEIRISISGLRISIQVNQVSTVTGRKILHFHILIALLCADGFVKTRFSGKVHGTVFFWLSPPRDGCDRYRLYPHARHWTHFHRVLKHDHV